MWVIVIYVVDFIFVVVCLVCVGYGDVVIIGIECFVCVGVRYEFYVLIIG